MDVRTLFGVDGKLVLVTGGGRGVGKMIASGFVANGACVYIASRNLAACEQTAQDQACAWRWIMGDVSSEEGCRRLAQELGQHEQRLDVLVNNSGMTLPGDMAQHSNEDQTATPEDGDRVIMIGTIAGITTLELPTYAYHTSKAALHHLTRVLAAHLAPNGGRILVNALALGFVPTEMLRNATLAMGANIEERGLALPLGRCGNPRDVAGAVLFLAAPASSWITGTVIVCDGGYTIPLDR